MKQAIVFLLLLMLTGCDPAYSPIIVNGSDQTLVFSTKFENTNYSNADIDIEPRGDFAQRRKGLKLESISVKYIDGHRNDFTSKQLTALRGNNPPEIEVWVLTADGIRLTDMKEIDQLRRRRH